MHRIFLLNLAESILTSEFDVQLAVYELIPSQNFSKSSPLVRWLLVCLRCAERKVIVVVGFLGIVIGSDFVHPKPNFLAHCVLQNGEVVTGLHPLNFKSFLYHTAVLLRLLRWGTSS